MSVRHSILYVDDEEMLLKVTQTYLQDVAGFKVDTVQSAQQALEKIRAGQYDAIISDYAMPHMNGIELLKEVRTTKRDIPFILLTGRGHEEVVIEAIDNGVDYYLRKGAETPYPYADLCQKIRESINRRLEDTRIRESEERFKGLAQLLPVPVFEASQTGHLTYVNTALYQMMGYQTDTDLTHITFADLFPSEDQNQAAKMLKTILSGAICQDGWECTMKQGIGDLREVMVYVSCIRDQGTDKPVGIRGVVFDITERKKTESALKKSREKLAILSGITRHDIVNQLHALQGYLSLLEESIAEGNTGEKYLSRINRCCTNINRHITFAHEYQDIGGNDPIWQNIEMIAAGAARELIPEHISLRIETGSVDLYADPMLILAFYNIFENAIKYGGDITRISVTFRNEGLEGVVIIEDDGIGVPSDMKEKIFEKGVGTNTGLGLFLVRQILEITHLTICENGDFGQGSRFEIRLPPGTWRQKSP